MPALGWVFVHTPLSAALPVFDLFCDALLPETSEWRGIDLAHLSFFEYCMLVQTKKRREATVSDVEFDPRHPKSYVYIQYLACTKSQVITVTFNRQLSQFQAEEESIWGGHPSTPTIKNNLAEVLLGLFLPCSSVSVFMTSDTFFTLVFRIAPEFYLCVQCRFPPLPRITVVFKISGTLR
jgi:hypothetical protein